MEPGSISVARPAAPAALVGAGAGGLCFLWVLVASMALLAALTADSARTRPGRIAGETSAEPDRART